MSTSDTPGHPTRILRDGLAQARAANAPADTILALRFAVTEAALVEITKTGGHAAIMASEALETISEPT